MHSRDTSDELRSRPGEPHHSGADLEIQDVESAAELTRFHPASNAPLPLIVRGCRLGDLPGLRRLSYVERLHQPDSLLMNFSPVRSGLRATLRWPGNRRRILVACAGDRVVGFAAFQPLRPDLRWRVYAAGAATGVYDHSPVLETLIERGVVLAGLNGVKRLYARVRRDVPVEEALIAMGFAPYATETLMVADRLPPRTPDRRLRPQSPADTWAIHQLYNHAVPRHVQYAEALTSHHWDISALRARESVDVRGWVIEEGHHVVGYAQVSTRRGAAVLEVIHHPERLDVLSDLIDGALAIIAQGRYDRVFSTVRGYQAEVMSVLAARGFTPLHDQSMLVKYTTANVRLPVFETVPIHVDVRERVPKRVPTFLQGQSGDESAT